MLSRHSQLFVLETVPNFFRDSPKVPQADLAGVVVIEELERAADLLHRISREDALGHWVRGNGRWQAGESQATGRNSGGKRSAFHRGRETERSVAGEAWQGQATSGRAWKREDALILTKSSNSTRPEPDLS